MNHYMPIQMRVIERIVPLFLSILFIMLFLDPVYADVPPHPSVTFSLAEFSDKSLYITLLTNKNMYWSYDADDIEKMRPDDNEKALVFDAFKSYADNDQLYFWGQIHNFQDGDYNCWLFSPTDFKLLIFDPDISMLYASDKISAYAFESFYSVSLQEGGQLSIVKTPHIASVICLFAIRVFITVIVELLIAFIFGYRDLKDLRLVIVVNIITQAVLNLFLSVSIYYNGSVKWCYLLLLLEITVFIIEAIIYSIWLKTYSRKRAILYTLVANLTSLYVGILP